MKSLNFFLIIILFFVLFSLDGSAIKIQYTDFDRQIYFEPNLHKEFIFTISDAERDANVPIQLDGDFAKYAVVEPALLKLKPGDKKQVKLTLDLPAEIPVGIHLLKISAIEKPAVTQKGAFILMPAVGVALKIINTEVKQACSVGMFNTEMNKKQVTAILNVANNGLDIINDAYAEYNLYDSEGLFVTSWKTGMISVIPFESNTKVSKQALNAVTEGYYTVKGTLYCAGKTFPLEKKILNHASEININDFRVYKKDGYFFVTFDTENPYLAPVIAHSSFGFFDIDGKSVRNYALNPGTIEPNSKKVFQFKKKTNWLDVPAGTYTIHAVLSFEGKRVTKTAQITLTEEELIRTEENTEAGFNAKYHSKPKQQEVVIEQPSGIAISGKTIIRLIAAGIIIAVLFLLLFKNIHKRE